MIEYHEFESILLKKIKPHKDENHRLMINIIDNPNRYFGLFRLSNSKNKLIQNITQSREIRFGDFLEELVELYFF